jgi:predicted DCC family thiol-disulfide oxidoreductase YuxK
VTVPVVRFTVAGTEATGCGPCRPYTVIYDADCKVCTRLAKALRKWDRGQQLEIVSSQQPGVMARFPWIPPRAYADALQLVAADGTTWQGAAAIEQLFNVLPRGRWISWVFHIPYVRALADRFYRWFARNRYRLGCGAHCQSRPLDVIWDEAEKTR